MTAVCHRCGERWPRHPALEVQCPTCHATVGVGCFRPSGHAGPLIEPHVEREQRAVDAGVLKLCTASAAQLRALPSQRLFVGVRGEGPGRKAESSHDPDSPHHDSQLALL